MSATTESESDQQQPALRVQDALGYLDQVKSEFFEQPNVYNQFLDIMKEFKSQTLDTPGVIARVSTLFRGHNDLIVGFNTFLPPGYRIEQMPHNNEIRVTTLQGIQQTPSTYTLVQPSLQPQQTPTQVAHVQQQQSQLQQLQQSPQPQASIQQKQTIQMQPSPAQHPPTAATQPQTQQPKPQQSPQLQQTIQVQPAGTPQQTQQPTSLINQSPLQPSLAAAAAAMQTTPATTPVQSSNAPPPPSSMQPGTEFGFNHALNYVNKIKHRFSAKPEIYQQFLEILHSYQRDQHATKLPRSKMALESEVYNQVAHLFQNQRDLLEEFSQFLPDANGTGSTGGTIDSLTRVRHQLSPGTNINSTHPPNIGLRNVNDGSIVMNDDISSVKRQNSRGANHQNKISMKRQNSVGNVAYNSNKRPKMTSLRDVSLAEAGKHGSLNEYAFFDKVSQSHYKPRYITKS